MEFDERREGNVVVLTPRGDMDATVLKAYEARLDSFVREGVRGLVWDLSGVTLLPSTAAGFLVSGATRLKEAGGRCAVAAPTRSVRATLRTLGLEAVLPVRDSLE